MASHSKVSLLIWATWIQGFVSFAFYYILIAFDGRQGQNMNLLFAVGQVICQWNNWTWHACANGYIFAQTTSWKRDFQPPFRQMSLPHGTASEDCSGHVCIWEPSKSVRITFQHVPCTQLPLAHGSGCASAGKLCDKQSAGSIEGLELVRERNHTTKSKQLDMIPGFNEPKWQICLLIQQQNRQEK